MRIFISFCTIWLPLPAATVVATVAFDSPPHFVRRPAPARRPLPLRPPNQHSPVHSHVDKTFCSRFSRNSQCYTKMLNSHFSAFKYPLVRIERQSKLTILAGNKSLGCAMERTFLGGNGLKQHTTIKSNNNNNNKT